ncbi:hypothetical protein ABID99_003451 [Mucilaginibacter sp. OAE612]|uniref:hypothetical protein n=1 Tax=Mucilaginibacter sp. OAE612 TaxID=3156444 RepID=UPI00359CBB93
MVHLLCNSLECNDHTFGTPNDASDRCKTGLIILLLKSMTRSMIKDSQCSLPGAQNDGVSRGPVTALTQL